MISIAAVSLILSLKLPTLSVQSLRADNRPQLEFVACSDCAIDPCDVHPSATAYQLAIIPNYAVVATVCKLAVVACVANECIVAAIP
ncbi:MAG: hypothetical protein AAGB19_14065 [Cyanobacteria bacterium P01_F01_bin.3]